MVDGAIARKTKSESKFGAIFDSTSDFIFLTASFVKLSPYFSLSEWLCVWIILIGIIKITNIIRFGLKKKLMLLHTPMNKAAGMLLFLLPLTLSFIETQYSVTTVCTISTVSVIQEIYYIRKV